MKYLQHYVEIKSTPEKIWEILVAVEKWNQWDKDVKTANLHGVFAEDTKGTLVAIDDTISTFFITAIEKPSYYSNYYQLPFLTRLNFTHRIEQLDNGCKVTFIAHFTGPLKWYFLFKQQKAILSVMQQAMANLVKIFLPI